MKYIRSVVPKPWELVLEEQELPVPAPGEALVKMDYAAICGTDMHIYQDRYVAQLPKVVGHEFSGTLAQLHQQDAASSALRPGDRVVGQPFVTCGNCDPCVTGHSNVCCSHRFFGTKVDGCFAQYALVSLDKLCRVQDQTDQRLACMTEPLAVVVHAVRQSGFMVGETAAILGSGPIGLLLALLLRMAGATNIVITEVNPYRIAFARNLGFQVLNSTEADFQARLKDCNGGEGYHKVFEVSAVGDNYKIMFDLVRERGTVMLMGLTPNQYPFNTMAFVFKEAVVKTVRVHSLESFRYAVRILGSGALNEEIGQIITHEFPFEEMKQAMDFAINDKEHMKVLIRF